MRVTADHQRLPAGLGMSLHDRTQWHGTIVESVAAVVAALFRLMTELRLAVAQRMMRGQSLDLRSKIVIEGVVRGPHVSPSGLPAGFWHHLRAEHCALGLDRHV